MSRRLLMMPAESGSPSRDELIAGLRDIRALVERQLEDTELWMEPHSTFASFDEHPLPPSHLERRLQQALRELHKRITDRTSFLDGGAVLGTREWFVLASWGDKENGMIPRDVVEAMGIDCSAEERGGTTIFSKDEAIRIHAHPDWHPLA